jgi:hypothetical protein
MTSFREYTYVVLNDGRVVYVEKSRYAPDDMFFGKESEDDYSSMFEASTVIRLAIDKEIVAFETRRYERWALRREMDIKAYDAKLEKITEIIKDHTKK